MSSSIPEAFADRAWVFAGAYATMQVGRTSFVLLEVGAATHWQPTSVACWPGSACRRVSGWLARPPRATSAWRCGRWRWPASTSRRCSACVPGLGRRTPATGPSRAATWPNAASCSSSSPWARRCWPPAGAQRGRTLESGGGVGGAGDLRRNTGDVVAVLRHLQSRCHRRDHPVRRPRPDGANFHYVHALLIAGIIATAVGNDLVMDHPGQARPGVRRHDGGRSAALPAGQCPLQARGLRRARRPPAGRAGAAGAGTGTALDAPARRRLADQPGAAGRGPAGHAPGRAPGNGRARSRRRS